MNGLERLDKWAAWADLPPAAHDPTSVHGLAAFARAHPVDWDAQIRCALGKLPEDLRSLTIGAALRTELAQQLIPRSPRDLNRVRGYRASARRLLDAAGHELMLDVDDALLEVIEERLVLCHTTCRSAEVGQFLAPDAVSRDVGLLHKLAVQWAYAAQIDPLVSGPRRKRGKPAEKQQELLLCHPPSIHEFGELLVASDPALRAAMGLAVGGGLGHSQILNLQFEQIDAEDRSVQLRARGSAGLRGEVRLVWLPGWAWDLLQPVLLGLTRAVARRREDSWWMADIDDRQRKTVGQVFLGRGAASRGRTDFNQPVKRACEAAFGPSGARYTMSDLHTLWMAVARARGLPRAVVRGSWSMPLNGTPPARALAAKQMAQEWGKLFGGPGAVEIAAVPSRAGSGGPWEPEVLQEGPAALPPSCRP